MSLTCLALILALFKLCFLPFSILCNFFFFWQLDMLQWAKGTAVNRTLVMWYWDVREGEVFYSPMIRPRSFTEPIPLDCEFHKCFSVCLFVFSPPPPLGGGLVGVTVQYLTSLLIWGLSTACRIYMIQYLFAHYRSQQERCLSCLLLMASYSSNSSLLTQLFLLKYSYF